MTTRRRWTAGIVCLLAAALASAQPAPPGAAGAPIKAIGVFTLLGENLDTSNDIGTEPTRLDRTERKSVAVPGIGFDQVLINEVQRFFTRTAPTVHLRLFTVPVAVSNADQMRLAEGAQRGALPEFMITAIQQHRLSHVLIVTRDRAPLSAQTASPERVGGVEVEGLGFHTDPQMQTRNVEDDSRTQGALIPHVIVRLTLFDADGARSLRSIRIDEQWLVGPRKGRTAATPWDLLDQREKVLTLHDSLRRGLEKALPELMRGP